MPESGHLRWQAWLVAAATTRRLLLYAAQCIVFVGGLSRPLLTFQGRVFRADLAGACVRHPYGVHGAVTKLVVAYSPPPQALMLRTSTTGIMRIR